METANQPSADEETADQMLAEHDSGARFGRKLLNLLRQKNSELIDKIIDNTLRISPSRSSDKPKPKTRANEPK